MKSKWTIGIITILSILLIIGMVIYFKYDVYYVTFAVDGTSYKELDVRKNTKISDIPKPEKEGYVFIGWYDEEGNLLDSSTVIQKNIVYYARWGAIVTEEENEKSNQK